MSNPTNFLSRTGFRAILYSDIAGLPVLTGGTVTSVSINGSNGIGVTGSPVTTSGTIALSLGNITPITVNALTLAAQTVGFTIAGGITSKTLTVPLNATVSGTNTGDVTLAGDTYLTISGQVITAHDVPAANVTGLALVATSGDYNDLSNRPVTTSGATYVLPAVDGAAGQVLSTDGAGNLSWINN